MNKKRMNLSLDEWIVDELRRRDDINASGAANQFFEKFLAGKDRDQAAMELRLKRLKEEEEKHQNKAQEKRAKWQQLEEELENQRADAEEERRRWFDKVRRVPRDPDHPVVENAADELDMDPAQVLTEAYDQ